MWISTSSSSITTQAPTMVHIFDDSMIKNMYTPQLINALWLTNNKELDNEALFMERADTFIDHIATDTYTWSTSSFHNQSWMWKFTWINNLVFLCFHTWKKITKEQLDTLLELEWVRWLSSFEAYYHSITVQYFWYLEEIIDIDELITYFGLEHCIGDCKKLFRTYIATGDQHRLFKLSCLIAHTKLPYNDEIAPYQKIVNTLRYLKEKWSDTTFLWSQLYVFYKNENSKIMNLFLDTVLSQVDSFSTYDYLKTLANNEIKRHYTNQLSFYLWYRIIYLQQNSLINNNNTSQKTVLTVMNKIQQYIQETQLLLDEYSDDGITFGKIIATRANHHDIPKVWNELKEIIDNELIRIYDKPTKWLFSIGWKIHLSESLDSSKVSLLESKYASNIGLFSTVHADQTINLPAVYKADELRYIITELVNDDIIPDNAELQLCIPWRLPNRLAWMLGSLILVLTDRCVEYNPDSFATTHDSLTWAKIMAYDAGALDAGFVFNTNTLVWRTDMLWRKSIIDIYHYQIIWSLLSQSVYWWLFSDLWKQFINEYEKILEKHQLNKLLDEQRIYNEECDTLQDAENHYWLVSQFTTLRHNDRASISPEQTVTHSCKMLLKKYIKLLLSID